MYPLLTELIFEKDTEISQNPSTMLKMIIGNLSKAVVKNGDQKGNTLTKVVRFFGQSLLGKKGAETAVFKNNGREAINLIKDDEITDNEGTIYPFGIVENLVCAEGFSADCLSLGGKVGLYEKESFMLVYALSGEYTVSYFGGIFRIKPEEMIFIPADFRIEVVGTGKLIIANAF